MTAGGKLRTVLTLHDLVANGTVSDEGAGILRSIGRDVGSFIVYSLPRNAGKSTVTEAILAEAPPGTPRHEFLGTVAERDALLAQPPSGYLAVAEMGHRGRPGYLAEDEIVRAFELVAHGFALATSLHADTVDELVEVLGRNGVPVTALAQGVRHLVKVQPLGDPFAPDTRRVVEAIHELTGVADGRLTSQLRYG
jgi:hypothetical protein